MSLNAGEQIIFKGAQVITVHKSPKEYVSFEVAKKSLVQVAAEKNFSIFDVPADGDCGLHAVVHQLSAQGISIDTACLRQRAVSFLRSHPQLMNEQFLISHRDKDVDSYLMRQSKIGQWVDEIMLRAVGASVSRTIRVLHDNGHVTELTLQTDEDDSVSRNDTQHEMIINIGLVGETHYVSLITSVGQAVGQCCSHDVITPSTASDHEDSTDVNKLPFVSDAKNCNSVSEVSSKHADKKGDSNIDVKDIDEHSPSFPQCWTLKQYVSKCEEYSWLLCQNGKLGCSVCFSAKSVKLHQFQGIKLSTEWVNIRVEPFGCTLGEQQQSLRKKMYDHKTSKAHQSAEMIAETAKKNLLQEANAKHSKNEHETTCRVFRTAYKIAKKERPFSDLPDDIDLQQLNGIDMGRILHTRLSCTNIITHVANEMRQKLVANIIVNEHKISVLIDESTSASGLTVLTVCMRAAVNESGPLTFFLDLVELSSADAKTITASLLKCLDSHGFNDAYLKKHFISFAADGASTMLGNKSGVATLLLKDFPDIFVWHCANHRLELAVGDTNKEVTGLNNFQSFIDKLYTTYHASPKNKRELKACAALLESQILSIGHVFDIRWVSSSERTLKAVWTNYPALYAHFLSASTDPERDHTTRQKYSGLNKRLTAVGFVNNVGVMLDALTELGDLSRELQKRDMTLTRAQKLVDRQIRVLESMADNAGPYLKEAKAGIAENSFKGIRLGTNTKVDIELRQGQYFKSLAANLRRRMQTTESSNVGTSEKAREANIQKYNNLLASIDVLNKDSWKDKECDALFGEAEIKFLCEKMKIDERTCILAFREFRDDSRGTAIPKMRHALQQLFHAVDTYVVSTAECERTFSVMNDISTPIRSRLNVAHLAQLVFLKCVGPPLSKFKPSDYVVSWIKKGRRSADDTHCPDRTTKESSHPYYDLWKLL